MKYQGVILGRQPSDFVLGGQVQLEINCEDWELHLIDPKWKIEHEIQVVSGQDTFACTIFSGNDVREMIMMNALKNNKIAPKDVKWLSDNGYFTNGYINFDDRVPAMHANIIKGLGTYQYTAADALRNWNVPEGILPSANNWNDYYDKSKLTPTTIELNKEFNKRFAWHWYWFNDGTNLNNQMKMSPTMSTVVFANGDNCLKPAGRHNHAVCEYGNAGDCRKINDSYNQQLKKYDPNFIANRLGFMLHIFNNMDTSKFLKDNDLKIVWNKDVGTYYMVLQGALRPFATSDRAILLMIEFLKRKHGSVSLSQNEIKDFANAGLILNF